MLLAYLDESYTKDFHFIAALVVPEAEAAALTAALDDVVQEASAAYSGVRVTSELHGYDLFHAEREWEQLEARQRIGVYNDAFRAVAEHDVKIILRGMNVKRQRERYRYPEDPHAVVLGHLIERVDEHAKGRGEWALLIADEVEGEHTYRQDLWTFQRYATPGYRSRKIVRVVDTMHFVPSHASRLVQAADLIAFLHRRRRTHVEKDERAHNANEALWARIQPRVVHDFCWRP